MLASFASRYGLQLSQTILFASFERGKMESTASCSHPGHIPLMPVVDAHAHAHLQGGTSGWAEEGGPLTTHSALPPPEPQVLCGTLQGLLWGPYLIAKGTLRPEDPSQGASRTTRPDPRWPWCQQHLPVQRRLGCWA